MPEIIISDTSCLIALDKIGELDILKCCYRQIYTTTEVAQEYGQALPDWIQIKRVENEELKRSFELLVDMGEASAIALALELSKDCKVILDDLRGRKLALSLNLKITGTLGIIVKAKQLNCISSAKIIIDKLRKVDFRLSEKIVAELLTQVGE